MKRFGDTLKLSQLSQIKTPDLHLNLPVGAFSPAKFSKDAVNHTKHIIRYSPQALFDYGFVNPKGSTMRLGLVLRTLIMCGVGTFVSQFRCDDKPKYHSFCFPILASAEGLIFASLITFLLGLFVSTTFSRWWSIREKLGVIMNGTAALTLVLRNFAVPEEAVSAASKTLLRWMHLAHALTYKQANDEANFQDLVKATIATEEDAEKLALSGNLNLPAVVYGWCMESVLALNAGSKLNPLASQTAALAHVTNCFNASQELVAFLNTQMPYAYLHLLAFTTKIHLIFVIFYAGGIIASGITGYAWTRVVLGYIIIITNNVIYEGLLSIHNMMVNPLGHDDGDFPTHMYVSNTFTLCNAMQSPPPESKEEDDEDEIRDGSGITVAID